MFQGAPLIPALVVLLLFCSGLAADDWPQWFGPQRDGVYREDGIVEKLPARLKYRWRRKIRSGYAGPAVANGRVFVTDAISEKGKRPSIERVVCLDEKTGNELWIKEYSCAPYTIDYSSGPRVTPTVDGDRVYTLGAMGDLFCWSVQDGKQIWAKNYVRDFKTRMNAWGMASAPLVDGDRLIALVGGQPNACVVAFDKNTGKELWRQLQIGDPGYSPPAMIKAGGKRQLIIWTPEHLSSLDPETGSVYWQEPFKINAALSLAMPVHVPKKNRLFVSTFYNGTLMMELDEKKPTARKLWQGKSDSEIKTDGLHALMCTPTYRDGHIYGVCSYGQLRCIKATDGSRVWESLAATGKGRWWNAFVVPHRNAKQDRYFICNEQGELIIARLTPEGYQETSRARLLETTDKVQGRNLVWSHPAFANRAVYARNDKEIVCADLAAE